MKNAFPKNLTDHQAVYYRGAGDLTLEKPELNIIDDNTVSLTFSRPRVLTRAIVTNPDGSIVKIHWGMKAKDEYTLDVTAGSKIKIFDGNDNSLIFNVEEPIVEAGYWFIKSEFGYKFITTNELTNENVLRMAYGATSPDEIPLNVILGAKTQVGDTWEYEVSHISALKNCMFSITGESDMYIPFELQYSKYFLPCSKDSSKYPNTSLPAHDRIFIPVGCPNESLLSACFNNPKIVEPRMYYEAGASQGSTPCTFTVSPALGIDPQFKYPMAYLIVHCPMLIALPTKIKFRFKCRLWEGEFWELTTVSIPASSMDVPVTDAYTLDGLITWNINAEAILGYLPFGCDTSQVTLYSMLIYMDSGTYEIQEEQVTMVGDNQFQIRQPGQNDTCVAVGYKKNGTDTIAWFVLPYAYFFLRTEVPDDYYLRDIQRTDYSVIGKGPLDGTLWQKSFTETKNYLLTLGYGELRSAIGNNYIFDNSYRFGIGAEFCDGNVFLKASLSESELIQEYGIYTEDDLYMSPAEKQVAIPNKFGMIFPLFFIRYPGE